MPNCGGICPPAPPPHAVAKLVLAVSVVLDVDAVEVVEVVEVVDAVDDVDEASGGGPKGGGAPAAASVESESVISEARSATKVSSSLAVIVPLSSESIEEKSEDRASVEDVVVVALAEVVEDVVAAADVAVVSVVVDEAVVALTVVLSVLVVEVSFAAESCMD